MMKIACAFCATLLASGALCAQTISAGQWEVSSDIRFPDNPQLQAQMAQVQAQLQNMPPQMREMMAKQMGGMSFVGPNKVRLCVTPEAAASAIQSGKREDGCIYTETGRKGNMFKGSVVCEQTGRVGDFITTVYSNQHYATEAVLKGSQGRVDVKSDAKWLASTCAFTTKQGK